MSREAAVEASIQEMVAAVNKGDFEAAVARFSSAPTIVEDIPPYRWQGPGAAAAWLLAMGENAEQRGARSITMTLSEPVRIEVARSAAYALFPGTLRLMAHAGELRSTGHLTLTLQEHEGAWLIETLVWSGPEPSLN